MFHDFFSLAEVGRGTDVNPGAVYRVICHFHTFVDRCLDKVGGIGAFVGTQCTQHTVGEDIYAGIGEVVLTLEPSVESIA